MFADPWGNILGVYQPSGTAVDEGVRMMDPADIDVPEHLEHRFTLRDGRTFAVAEWGDPAGSVLHDPRDARRPDQLVEGPDDLRAVRDPPADHRPARLRRVDATARPASSPTSCRTSSRLPTPSGSTDSSSPAGRRGPHALAMAAMLPDRVIRCMASVSVAPYGVDGLDWMDGLTEGNVIEFQAALEGEEACRRLLTGLREELLTRLGAGRTDWMGDDYHLSEADKAMMVKHLDRVRAQMVYSLVPGVDGWVDDDIAFTKPWGFEVTDIHVPIVLTYGRTDVLVPPAHGDWLAARIPGAEAWVDEDAGHMGDDSQVERDMAWLAQPDPHR